MIFDPLIYICSFFKDIDESYNLTERGVLVLNLVFSLAITTVYGFFIAFLFGALLQHLIRNDQDGFKYFFFSILFLIQILQVLIIYTVRELKIVMPEIYLNFVYMFTIVMDLKYFRNTLVKTILYFFLFLFSLIFLVSSFNISRIGVELIFPIIVNLALIFPIMILSKKPCVSLKSVAEVCIAQGLLTNIYIVFSIYMIFSDYNNLQNYSLIFITMVSIAFLIENLLKSFTNLYTGFVDVFHSELNEEWEEKLNKYGFSRYLASLVNERNSLISSCKEIRLMWNNGSRITLIKRWLQVCPFIILLIYLEYLAITQKLHLYFDNLVMLLSKKWIELFNGNTEDASMAFFLLILLSLFCYNVSHYCKCEIKEEKQKLLLKSLFYSLSIIIINYFMLKVKVVLSIIALTVVFLLELLIINKFSKKTSANTTVSDIPVLDD